MAPLGNCQSRNLFGYPNCIATQFREGELIFRLGTYGYSRSRANDACNAMGGYMFVPENEADHNLANEILNLSVGNAQNAVILDLNDTESWIGLTLMQTMNGDAWYGVTCRSFHICNSFETHPQNDIWNDCTDPDCSSCNRCVINNYES